MFAIMIKKRMKVIHVIFLYLGNSLSVEMEEIEIKKENEISDD